MKCDHKQGSRSPVPRGTERFLESQCLSLHAILSELLHEQILLPIDTVSSLGCVGSGIPGWRAEGGLARGWLGTGGPGAELEPERGLEAAAEAPVAEAVDDGVDAAVGEGQPVSQGIDIHIDQLQLHVRQTGIVGQQHQAPQGKPGQGEEQGDKDEHVDGFLLPPPRSPPLLLAALPRPGHGCAAQGNADPGVHEHDERQRSQVDVGKEHRGVGLPHGRLGPLLPAPEHRAGGVARAQEQLEALLLPQPQQRRRGTHDGHGQRPDHRDGGHGSGDGQLRLEGMHDAPEPAAGAPEELCEERLLSRAGMHTHFKLPVFHPPCEILPVQSSFMAEKQTNSRQAGIAQFHPL